MKTISRLILFVCLTSAMGCAAPRVAQPLTATIGASDPDTQLEFWYQLAQRPLACNDDTFHALLLYLDGNDTGANYSARVAELKRRHLLTADFNRPGDEAIERGTFAVALVSAPKIHGGLMLSVLGPTPRYATRELEYMNLYPPSSPSQEFSGMEIVGIIGRVEDFQRGNAGQPTTPVAAGGARPGR